MDFKKMHGLGNDFIIIDGRNRKIHDIGGLSKKICARNTGVGADGLIMVFPSQRADIKMAIYNSDGSRAEMCGNGLRCFAKYVYEEGIVNKTTFSVDTPAGIMHPRLVLEEDGRVKGAIVNMGCPVFEPSRIPVACSGKRFIDIPVEIDKRVYNISTIAMGVPHSIIYVDNIQDIDIGRIGSAIENHPLFPRKTNVNFVQLLDRNVLGVSTWERGVGRTLACGTGSCAAAVVSAVLGKTGRKVKVKLQLGQLLVSWEQDGQVLMEGDAANVFLGKLSGEIYPLQS